MRLGWPHQILGLRLCLRRAAPVARCTLSTNGGALAADITRRCKHGQLSWRAQSGSLSIVRRICEYQAVVNVTVGCVHGSRP